MRTGRRVAFDVGKARIGVAVSDFHAILASPSEHIKRTSDEQALTLMRDVLIESEAIEVYVGLPVNLRGESTESTKDAVAIAQQLADLTEIPVYLIDERLTTSVASKAMSNAGKSSKEQRGSIDSAAATVILEQALEVERRNGAVSAMLAKDYSDA